MPSILSRDIPLFSKILRNKKPSIIKQEKTGGEEKRKLTDMINLQEDMTEDL